MNSLNKGLPEYKMGRRAFTFGGIAAVLLSGNDAKASLANDLGAVRALTFDMQGTVFDFYGPISKVAQQIGRRAGLVDRWAHTLPANWSNAAHDIIIEISGGRIPWASNTQVYREALAKLLKTDGFDGHILEADREQLLSVWSHMEPWPDSLPGISNLRRKYIVSTLTNAPMSQMVSLVKSAGLPFDAILTGELNHRFKPDPKVYQLATEYIGLKPGELLMVSAHKWDLHASKRAGFKTAYVPRPMELGPGYAIDDSPNDFIDIAATDLIDLSRKLCQ